MVSSPDLKKGSTLAVYAGGRTTGEMTDGLVSGGAYTPGTQVDSLTLSGVATAARFLRGQVPATSIGDSPFAACTENSPGAQRQGCCV